VADARNYTGRVPTSPPKEHDTRSKRPPSRSPERSRSPPACAQTNTPTPHTSFSMPPIERSTAPSATAETRPSSTPRTYRQTRPTPPTRSTIPQGTHTRQRFRVALGPLPPPELATSPHVSDTDQRGTLPDDTRPSRIKRLTWRPRPSFARTRTHHADPSDQSSSCAALRKLVGVEPAPRADRKGPLR
jgi:hypothetical protein